MIRKLLCKIIYLLINVLYMKILKKIVQIIIISSSVIVPCFSYNYTFDTPCMYLLWWDKDKDEPYKYQLAYDESDYKDIKHLTKHFCQKAYAMKCSDTSDWEYAVDYFDASQSIFLSILCNSVWEWENYKQNDYLKKRSFLDFYIITSETWYTESCHPWWNMNNCDYSYHLPSIFNEIMDDFFSIKQARNLWVDKMEDSFTSNDAAKNFIIWNFKWIPEDTCGEGWKYYKTTCKTLEWYMKDARNLLKNTQVINVERLDDRKWVDCENDFKNNILYCGLLWSDSDYKFINAVYNEYLWYNLFLSYYSFYIDGSDYLNDTNSTVLERLQENKEKRYLVQDQILKSKQAITTSLKSLSEITYSFPLHIWFLMYHEDAKLFMENISKIYAPIRTLYDKLRNVQIKES